MSENRVFQATDEGRVEVKPAPVEPAGRMPEVMTFSTHVLSLNAAALFHLGLIEEPGVGPHKDLEAARHIVDTLAMLREKTRGNLTAEESSLLDALLHELRIRFVQAR